MLSNINHARFARLGVPQLTWFVDDPDFLGIREVNPGDIFFTTDERGRDF